MSRKKSEEEAKQSFSEEIESIRDEIEQIVGKDTRLTGVDSYSKIDNWTSSGSIVVDKVLAGGRPTPCSLIPFGRQIEISGPPNSGKSSLCAQIAKEVQKMGGLVLLSDAEQRSAHDYLVSLGVNLDQLISLPATSLEVMFRNQINTIKTLAKRGTKVPILMLLDAIGSLSSEAILEDDDPMSRGGMASDARIISHGIKQINQLIASMRISYIFSNHQYYRVGTIYGNPMETGGGQKLKYLATVRLSLSQAGAIKEDDKVIGHRVRIKALKNSMAPMLLEKEAVLLGNRGFSNEYTVYEKGRELGLIEGKGWKTWTPPGGEGIRFQSFGEFEEKVVKHPDYKTLETQVAEAL